MRQLRNTKGSMEKQGKYGSNKDLPGYKKQSNVVQGVVTADEDEMLQEVGACKEDHQQLIKYSQCAI